MKTTRIARKLGLDGNPLRRRTDKIAARLAALLLGVFVTGAPGLSVAAAGSPLLPGPGPVDRTPRTTPDRPDPG